MRNVFRGSLLISLGVLLSSPALCQNNSWDVAVLDQILAAVPPGRSLVRIDDMDILVSRLKGWRNRLAGVPSPELAFDGVAPMWTGGNVYFNFDGSVTVAHQKVFMDCAAEWATFANLHFIPRASQANYITVQEEVTSGEGGHSAVGMVGGQQFLVISTVAWDHATVCHELGHALGLVHEHQRSDRDSFVTILTNNIQAGLESNFVKLSNSQNKTAYDFLSIMHYARDAFSANTLDTIEPIPAYVQYIDIMGIVFDPVLSAGDRAGMASGYGAGPVIGPVVTNTQDSGVGSLRTALYYGYDHPGTTVSFNIPTSDPGFSNQVFNILPSDRLPSLFHATTVDGSTETTNSNPNGPEIMISGALAFPSNIFASGLRMAGTNCLARSLVINGWSRNGITIEGTNATGNAVEGCFLGINPAGTSPVTNRFAPVEIQSGATGNRVGGTTTAARNVISGSFYQGVAIHDSGTRNNSVQGNYVGLNATGTASLSNRWSGIEIYAGASSNIVGGGNVISGNGDYGVLIHQDGCVGNIVQGNFIGLNALGSAALPNTSSGIALREAAQSTIIGGSTAPLRNIISGNGVEGIEVADAGTMNNVIQGNYIGTDPSGVSAIPNAQTGVAIFFASQSNVVGGPGAGSGNLISGNANYGIFVSDEGTSNNVIQGNFIGVDVSGADALGNAWAGVTFRLGASFNLLGGSSPGAGNVISGNGNQGVGVGETDTTGNVIAGNYIGVNATGTAAIANGWSGVDFFLGPQGNTVGGGPGARNVISGNLNYGVMLRDYSSGNSVVGNTIGLDVTGTVSIPNVYAGLVVFGGSYANLVGGTSTGSANLIAGNASDGVQVADAVTTNNSVRANSIFANAGVGIGVYNGANESAAAPSLTSAVLGTNTSVSGTLNSLPSTTFHLDFYASAPPAVSAQARTWLGTKDVTTTGGGGAGIAASLATVPEGWVITATATDPAGNTSPLSAGRAVTTTDTVADGIPNAWRQLYFSGSGTSTNAQSCAACDADHDGMSNLQEFLAGTNPTNAASVLRLSSLTRTGSSVTLGFVSAPGLAYRIEARDDLGAGTWSLLSDQLLGTGGLLQITDPGEAGLPHRFYRLDAEP